MVYSQAGGRLMQFVEVKINIKEGARVDNDC